MRLQTVIIDCGMGHNRAARIIRQLTADGFNVVATQGAGNGVKIHAERRMPTPPTTEGEQP